VHVDAVITRRGDDEPTAGFSQDFPGGSSRTVRHTFLRSEWNLHRSHYFSRPTFGRWARWGRAPPTNQGAAPSNNQGKMRPPSAGDDNPNPIETSFQRQVSLAGGEVIVSPD